MLWYLQMHQVLFICTGNYYRSRYAEILFNRFAEAKGVAGHAVSRGLATEVCRTFPGVISPFVVEALCTQNLTCDSIHRQPAQLTQADLLSAKTIIALKEAEHRPLLKARYPGWEDKVTYWHIHDLDAATPDVALNEIEMRVREWVNDLSEKSTNAS